MQPTGRSTHEFRLVDEERFNVVCAESEEEVLVVYVDGLDEVLEVTLVGEVLQPVLVAIRAKDDGEKGERQDLWSRS